MGQGTARGAQRVRAAPLTAFTRFIGIDWSGARGCAHPSIVVASARAGSAAPTIVPPPGRAWSREGVLGWLRDVAASGERALIGMDFSFAPPFLDAGAYLPGTDAPDSARTLWGFVDAAAQGETDLGAADLLGGALRAHFYHGAASGAKAGFQRWRLCEAAFNRQGGGKASSVFDCVGASQVAKGSFAGMRLLHRLGSAMPVWPFDPLPAQGPLLVEIYTRALLRRAGGSGRKLRDMAGLNAALEALGSRPWASKELLSDHATDALVAAAALRHAAGDALLWHPPALTPLVARTEGWTFGVT